MPIGTRRRFFYGSTGRFSPFRFLGCMLVPLVIILVPVFLYHKCGYQCSQFRLGFNSLIFIIFVYFFVG